LDKVKNGMGAFGFNAATEQYEDLLKNGIVDPTKVVRTALQNAASVAGLLLTTEAMIAEKPEKRKRRRRCRQPLMTSDRKTGRLASSAAVRRCAAAMTRALDGAALF
jgi:hypothetical protein